MYEKVICSYLEKMILLIKSLFVEKADFCAMTMSERRYIHMSECRYIEVIACRFIQISECRYIQMSECRYIQVSACQYIQTSECRYMLHFFLLHATC